MMSRPEKHEEIAQVWCYTPKLDFTAGLRPLAESVQAQLQAKVACNHPGHNLTDDDGPHLSQPLQKY